MLAKIRLILSARAGGLRREEGQTLAEYGLILALIAVASIIALGALGLAISGQLDVIVAALP
jgi:Flp pilus assembly pilin Flp